MRLAFLEHPIVVEVTEQLAAAHSQRLVAVPRGEQPIELPRVDPDVGTVLDAHGGAARGDARRCRFPSSLRRAASPVRRLAHLLQHVRPEHRGDATARMDAGMQASHPSSARARPLAILSMAAVDLHRKLAEHADADHCVPSVNRLVDCVCRCDVLVAAEHVVGVPFRLDACEPFVRRSEARATLSAPSSPMKFRYVPPVDHGAKRPCDARPQAMCSSSRAAPPRARTGGRPTPRRGSACTTRRSRAPPLRPGITSRHVELSGMRSP